MSVSSVARFGFSALMIAFWIATQAPGVQAQQRGGTPQTDKVQPVNSGAIVSSEIGQLSVVLALRQQVAVLKRRRRP